MIDKAKLLRDISIGSRVAEDEGENLREYFVKTQQWQSIKDGRVDIIYGAKGSGKSAIYSLLTRNRVDFISEQGIVLIPAENPRGEVAFNYLVNDPPSSEEQFRSLWKLYILCLVAKAVDYFSVGDPAERKRLAAPLMQAKLLPSKWNLQAILSSVLQYVKAISPEGGVKLDPSTGVPVGFYGKISLRENAPNGDGAKPTVSIDEMLSSYNRFLSRAEFKIWLLLDRLDVAFSDSSDLERNALRALFRVYLDLVPLTAMSLKIFLRNDIWHRISATGFREASHVTRTVTLEWNSDALLNLVVRRLLYNKDLATQYEVNRETVLNRGARV